MSSRPRSLQESQLSPLRRTRCLQNSANRFHVPLGNSPQESTQNSLPPVTINDSMTYSVIRAFQVIVNTQ